MYTLVIQNCSRSGEGEQRGGLEENICLNKGEHAKFFLSCANNLFLSSPLQAKHFFVEMFSTRWVNRRSRRAHSYLGIKLCKREKEREATVYFLTFHFFKFHFFYHFEHFWVILRQYLPFLIKSVNMPQIWNYLTKLLKKNITVPNKTMLGLALLAGQVMSPA